MESNSKFTSTLQNFPLHAAINKNDFDTTLQLIKEAYKIPEKETRQAILWAKDSRGRTPLHLICRGPDSYPDLGTYHEKNIQRLEEIENRFIEILHTLLQEGSAELINLVDNYGETPLHLVIREARNLRMLLMLIKFGADPFKLTGNQESILHLAACGVKHTYGLLKIIIERVLNKNECQLLINAADYRKQTPLHHLVGRKAYFEQLKTCNLLLEAGASVQELNDYQETPLSLAVRFGADIKVLAALVQAGASIHERDIKGRTLLHHAVEGAGMHENSNVEILQWLLDQGASLSIMDYEGITPLAKAQDLKKQINKKPFSQWLQGRKQVVGNPKLEHSFSTERTSYDSQIVSFLSRDQLLKNDFQALNSIYSPLLILLKAPFLNQLNSLYTAYLNLYDPIYGKSLTLPTLPPEDKPLPDLDLCKQALEWIKKMQTTLLNDWTRYTAGKFFDILMPHLNDIKMPIDIDTFPHCWLALETSHAFFSEIKARIYEQAALPSYFRSLTQRYSQHANEHWHTLADKAYLLVQKNRQNAIYTRDIALLRKGAIYLITQVQAYATQLKTYLEKEASFLATYTVNILKKELEDIESLANKTINACVSTNPALLNETIVKTWISKYNRLEEIRKDIINLISHAAREERSAIYIQLANIPANQAELLQQAAYRDNNHPLNNNNNRPQIEEEEHASINDTNAPNNI